MMGGGLKIYIYGDKTSNNVMIIIIYSDIIVSVMSMDGLTSKKG